MKITQKVEFSVSPDAYFSGWGVDSIEFVDVNDNKVIVKLSPDQFKRLADSLQERHNSYLERLKDKS